MKKFSLSLFIVTFSAFSFGWGKYGHQQTSSAAISILQKLLKKSPIAACLKKNYSGVVWLGSAPDEVFKMNPQSIKKLERLQQEDPNNEEIPLLEARRNSNRVEHNLHFYQIDFLLPNGVVNATTIKLLPTNPDFKISFPLYKKLIENNRTFINNNVVDVKDKIDGPVTIRHVDREGTAPQRVIQLYDLAVTELKAGNLKKGIFYLGLLSHYEADKGQPFHATGATFNGQGYKDPETGEKSTDAIGVHSAFEEHILESAAKAKGLKLVDDVWQFGATEDTVVNDATALATNGKLSPLTREGILSENFNQIASGVPLIDPVQNAYAEAKRNVVAAGHTPRNDRDSTFGRLVDKEFEKMSVKTSKGPVKVLTLALQRIAGASLLLSRIWNQAYQDALAENGQLAEQLNNCDDFGFDTNFTASNYPALKYLLDLGLGAEAGGRNAAEAAEREVQ